MSKTKNSFKVTYSVDDGYVGKERPQYVRILEEDLEEDMSDEDIEKILHDSVQDDFEQNISPSVSDEMVESFMEWSKDVIESRKSECDE